MGGNFKNPVELLIITGEAGTAGNVSILVDGTHGIIFRTDIRQVCIAHGLTRTTVSDFIRTAEEIAVLRVQRFRARLTQIDNRAAGTDDFQCGCELGFKGVEHTAFQLFHRNGFINSFRENPFGRITGNIGIVPVVCGRNRRRGIVLHHPAFIRTDHLTGNIDRGDAADAPDVNGDTVRAGGSKDQDPKGMLFFIQLDIAHGAGNTGDVEGGLFRQIVDTAEDNPVAESIAFPKGGPGASPLHTGEVLLHGVVQFKITGIP